MKNFTECGGNLTSTPDYVGINALGEEFLGILTAKRDSVAKRENNQKVRDFIYNYFNEEYLNEWAAKLVYRINRDMNDNLHLVYHLMWGRLANIKVDFPDMVIKEYPNREADCSYWEAIKRLDANEHTEKAEQDRNVMRKIFWKVFADDYDIAYRFGEKIDSEVFRYFGVKEKPQYEAIRPRRSY